MAITPRKDEVAAVVALLESDQFDTSTGMAITLIKLVAGMLSERDTHGVAVGMPGRKPALAIGPCYSVRDARSIAKDAQESGMEARIARLSGTGSIKAGLVLRTVCACGHRTESHVWSVCAIANCDCQAVNFEKGN